MVPLNLNKLDLRDYLYNVYNIKVLSVRSFVAQSPVRQDKPDAERPKPRKWYREKAKKYMIAEMERPFVWPDVPEDFAPWVILLPCSSHGLYGVDWEHTDEWRVLGGTKKLTMQPKRSKSPSGRP